MPAQDFFLLQEEKSSKLWLPWKGQVFVFSSSGSASDTASSLGIAGASGCFVPLKITVERCVLCLSTPCSGVKAGQGLIHSFLSFSPQNSSEMPETITSRDAARFPIVASCTLLGLYLFFKVSEWLWSWSRTFSHLAGAPIME